MNYWQNPYGISSQTLDRFYVWQPRPGLTGFVPTLWLFVVWFWNGGRLFNLDGINASFAKRHQLLQVFKPVYWIDLRKVRPDASKRRRKVLLSLAYTVAAGTNICLSRFLPVWYLPFCLTASGLYASIRLSSALRRERSLGFWLAFAIVTAASDAGAIIDNIKEPRYYEDYSYFHGFIGRWFCIPVLLPFLMLLGRHNRSEIIAMWRQMEVRLRGSNSGAVSTI